MYRDNDSALIMLSVVLLTIAAVVAVLLSRSTKEPPPASAPQTVQPRKADITTAPPEQSGSLRQVTCAQARDCERYFSEHRKDYPNLAPPAEFICKQDDDGIGQCFLVLLLP